MASALTKNELIKLNSALSAQVADLTAQLSALRSTPPPSATPISERRAAMLAARHIAVSQGVITKV